MDYDETVAYYDRMDRILKIKMTAIISLLVVMLFATVIYAFSIERKLSALSDAQHVVINKAGETTTNFIGDRYTAESYAVAENETVHTTECTQTVSDSEENVSGVGEEATGNETTAGVNTYRNDKKVFYVTKTGKKYHVDGCQYLKTKIEITYGEIIDGNYEPCSKCIK